MELVIIFVASGLIYMGLEILWRARTHLSMGIAGGLCGMLLWWLYSIIDAPVWLAYIIGLILISLVELAAGIVLNLKLKLAVWDYSKMPLNILGQVCPAFSMLWGLMGVAVWYALGKRLSIRRSLSSMLMLHMEKTFPYHLKKQICGREHYYHAKRYSYYPCRLVVARVGH